MSMLFNQVSWLYLQVDKQSIFDCPGAWKRRPWNKKPGIHNRVSLLMRGAVFRQEAKVPGHHDDWISSSTFVFMSPFRDGHSLGASGVVKFMSCYRLWASLVAQSVKNLPPVREAGFNPCFGRIPWRREWQPTPVSLPGEFHGESSPAGYSPWGHMSGTWLSD